MWNNIIKTGNMTVGLHNAQRNSDKVRTYKLHILTLKVLVTTIDALGHFETG